MGTTDGGLEKRTQSLEIKSIEDLCKRTLGMSVESESDRDFFVEMYDKEGIPSTVYNSL